MPLRFHNLTRTPTTGPLGGRTTPCKGLGGRGLQDILKVCDRHPARYATGRSGGRIPCFFSAGGSLARLSLSPTFASDGRPEVVNNARSPCWRFAEKRSISKRIWRIVRSVFSTTSSNPKPRRALAIAAASFSGFLSGLLG